MISGGLFDESDPSEETAFKHAVERVNSEITILPRSRLSTQIEKLSYGDSYHASNKGRQIFIKRASVRGALFVKHEILY